MLVHSGEPERWRIERSGRLAVGTECLAVEIELGIELARSPAGENLFHGRLVHLQHLRERAEVRRRVNDRAYVQVAIGPAVETMADPGRECVIHGRVSERPWD